MSFVFSGFKKDVNGVQLAVRVHCMDPNGYGCTWTKMLTLGDEYIDPFDHVCFQEPSDFGMYECSSCHWRYVNYSYGDTRLWTRAIWEGNTPRHLLSWDEFAREYGNCASRLQRLSYAE